MSVDRHPEFHSNVPDPSDDVKDNSDYSDEEEEDDDEREDNGEKNQDYMNEPRPHDSPNMGEKQQNLSNNNSSAAGADDNDIENAFNHATHKGKHNKEEFFPDKVENEV